MRDRKGSNREPNLSSQPPPHGADQACQRTALYGPWRRRQGRRRKEELGRGGKAGEAGGSQGEGRQERRKGNISANEPPKPKDSLIGPTGKPGSVWLCFKP